MQTQGTQAAGVLKWMQQQSGGGILTTKQVVDAAQHLIQDDSRVGTILLIMARGPLLEWQPARNNLVPFTPRPSKSPDMQKPAQSILWHPLRTGAQVLGLSYLRFAWLALLKMSLHHPA